MSHSKANVFMKNIRIWTKPHLITFIKYNLFHDPDTPARGLPKASTTLRVVCLFCLFAFASKLATLPNKKAIPIASERLCARDWIRTIPGHQLFIDNVCQNCVGKNERA